MAELDYSIPDEERKRNLWTALAMASGGLLGAQKGREWEALGRAGQNFIGYHDALNRGWQDQQQERLKSQMMQMQMDAYRQQQADLAEQRRLQEGLGPLMAGMPTLGQGAAPPQAGVAPRTAAQFGLVGGDSLDATTMPPAPRTQAVAGPYEAFLAKAQYLEEQAQRNPRMAPALMKMAEGYYAQAEKWRSKNYGSLQAVRGPDGRPVMAQQQEYGAPQLTGYQPPPDLQASNGGDRQIIWDKSGVAPMPDMVIRQSADNAATVGATIRGQNMLDARTRESNALAAGKQGNEAADALRKEFNGLQPVQAWGQVAPALSAAREAMGTDTQAADLNLIYAMAKIMDPGSVVRESETEMVIKTGSPAQRLLGQWNAVKGGARLTPQIRAQLMQQIEARARGYEAPYKAARTTYEGLATKRGVPAADVFIDPAVTAAPAAAAAPAAPAAPAKGYDTARPGEVYQAPDGTWRKKR